MKMLQSAPAVMDQWSTLRANIQGEVIAPGDPQYDQARLAWNLTVDQHPAVIVVPQHTADVVTAVQFACEVGLGIAVQATGHGNVRPANGAMLMLTSAMQEVYINPETRTAWVSAGAKWEPVLKKAQAAGLAPLLGSTPDVGAVGYTLGGGFGWLGRKYGLSLDNVNSFELVTAVGELLVASKTENPDLFWGLRGGGGSLGIITGMEIRLFPVTDVYGGNLIYPIDMAKEVFARYRSWIQSAPDELTSSIIIMNYPPLPEMPEPLRGQSFVQVRGCYSGNLAQGEELLRYWRDWRAPFIDDFKPMPFADVATISNDPIDPLPGLSSGAWVHELSDDVIETLIKFGSATMGSPLIFAEVRHVGGAVSQVKPGSTAYSNRDANHILQVVGVAPTPESHRDLQQYYSQLMQALGSALTGGVYLSFLEGVEAQDRVEDGYSPLAFQRLRELKARYDPENRLRFSFNISPAQ